MKIFSILKFCFHHIKEYGNGITTNACISITSVVTILEIRSNSISYLCEVTEIL